MQTRKLYYEDCHLTSFTARVLECSPEGEHFRVTLDATAFYPEGGGQPWDLGELGDARVLAVREQEDRVVHFCDRALPVGETVEGRIDFARRFDFMQQHTGEHILSGLIHTRFGYHNVGFHMGARMVTIDFDGPIPPEALAEIEAEANGIVWKNLPLHIWYPSEEALPGISYRTKRALPWPVRLVEVPGVDRCACCGVHTAATGEVGLVKIFSCVKFHQGVRLEIGCGRRAYAYLNEIYEQNRQVSQVFSAKPLETGQAARQMNEALAAEKFRTTGLLRRIFGEIARENGGKGNVLHFEPGLEAGQVRELSDAIGETCGGVAAVFSGDDGAGYRYCLTARQGDLRSLGKAMTAALNGRGGGKPAQQQGTLHATQAAIRAFFEDQ